MEEEAEAATPGGEIMDISSLVEVEMARTWVVDGDSFIDTDNIKNTDFRAVKYENGEIEGTKYICNICNNEFAQVARVKRHITTQHMKKKQESKEPAELNDMVAGKKMRDSPGHEEKEDKRLKAVRETFDMERVKKFLDTTPLATSTQTEAQEQENIENIEDGNDNSVVQNTDIAMDAANKSIEELTEKVAKLEDESKVKDAKIKSLEETIETNRHVTIIAQAEKQNLHIYLTEKEKQNKNIPGCFYENGERFRSCKETQVYQGN